jgi:DNA-binding LytR/AlgR family response regulator
MSFKVRGLIMPMSEYSCIIAEDNLETNKMLTLFANQSNLTVLDNVISGRSLIESAVELSPDIIITDIHLERIDGITACKTLLDKGLHSQIIIVSGTNEISDVIKSIKIGTIDFLGKPVLYEEFEKAISKAKSRIDEVRTHRNLRKYNKNIITVKNNYRDIDIDDDEIIFIEKLEKRIFHIHLIDGRIIETSTNFQRIKEQSSEALFSPHKSYMANFHQIRTVLPNLAVEGNYDIVFKNIEITVPLTRRNYSEYLALKLKFKN